MMTSESEEIPAMSERPFPPTHDDIPNARPELAKGDAARGPASVKPEAPAPAPAPPGDAPGAARDRTVQKLGMVKLFFATDRKWTGSTEQPKWFGPDWNGRKLTYGTCVVSIPPKHEPGRIEKPSVFRFEFAENPDKHVIVHAPKRLDEAPYFAALRAELTARPQKEITVFIHGYNSSFDTAASRLGVLAFDMDFNGVPVLYSWSSQGGGWGPVAYARDEEIVAETIRPLAGFLARVAEEGRAAGAKRINVVAHSMGNRALVGALEELAREQPGRLILDEVVMAAPDVKKVGFVDSVWPQFKTLAKRYTLYASDDDKALHASKEVHTWPRIGQAGEELLLIEGLDTIDATGCDFSMLGLNHSYFGSPEVVEDLKALLSKALTPAARKLREKKRQLLLYWLLPESELAKP